MLTTERVFTVTFDFAFVDKASALQRRPLKRRLPQPGAVAEWHLVHPPAPSKYPCPPRHFLSSGQSPARHASAGLRKGVILLRVHKSNKVETSAGRAIESWHSLFGPPIANTGPMASPFFIGTDQL